jgi:hypothetical protein
MALGFGTQHTSQFPMDGANPPVAAHAHKGFSRISGMVLGMLGALALAGCGNGSREADVTTAPAPAAPQAVATAAPTPAGPTLPYARKVEKQGGGVAGIAVPGTKGPAIKPATPGKPPRMMPVPGVPTPIQPPRGQAATPGKRATRSTVVIQKPGGGTTTVRASSVRVVKPTPSPTP